MGGDATSVVSPLRHLKSRCAHPPFGDRQSPLGSCCAALQAQATLMCRPDADEFSIVDCDDSLAQHRVLNDGGM